MNEIQTQINSYKWWHCIDLNEHGITPGICPHGNGEFDTRWGFPANFNGATVLDIGIWDGLFSFEAEKRGAKVQAIDIYQAKEDKLSANLPFQLAKKLLKSNVTFNMSDLESWNKREHPKYDYIFHFGIFYHIKNPLEHVEILMNLCKPGGTVLVETAISKIQGTPVLEYMPRRLNDKTNVFYPNIEWIQNSFIESGAYSVRTLWTDGNRASFEIIKKNQFSNVVYE